MEEFFIDKKGKVVIPCEWEDTMPFSYGFTNVKGFDGKWLKIDKIGKIFKNKIMNRAFLLSFSFFCVLGINAQINAQREYDYIGTEVNNAGLRIVGIKNPQRTYRVGEIWYDLYYGCIDLDGNEVIPLKYKKISLSKDWNYIVIETTWDGNKESVGLLSEDGKHTIISPNYKDILISPKTFIKFKCAIVKTHNGHYGIVDHFDKIVVSLIYDYLDWMDEGNGHLAAKLNKLWGIIDYKGKEIVAHQYHEMVGYNGYALVQKGYYKSDCQTALIDSKGNTIIDFNYGNLWDFDGWTLWAEKNDKYALLNTKGNIILPFKNYGKRTSIGEQRYSNSSEHFYEYMINVPKELNYFKSNGDLKQTIYFDDNGQQHSSSKEAMAANKIIRKNDNNNTYDLATLTWNNINGVVQQQNYELSVSVTSDSKIEEVAITVNGTPDRGINIVNSSDYDMTINRTLTLNEGENVIKVSVKNAAGTAQEEKTIVYRPQGGELPSIEWLDFAATANKKEYQMKLGIKSKSKVEEVNVTVNGVLTRGIKTVASDGYDLTVDRTLSLSEGLNRIVVSVRNGDGISTSEKVITYQGNNPTPVFNDKRIAFVIGNSHYSNSEMNLANPENDAKDVAEKLKGLGFEVVLKLDATLEDMDRELTSFGQKAKEYDVAMFYYAGHGIQSKGVNYLIPTNIDNLAEDNMKYKCVDMERVLDVMEDSKCKLKIVILDACRNDPLSRRWHRSAGTRGLSLMNAPIGTIISFSTSPGSTALDGKGRNSPYTEAFLNTLDMPNLDVFHFFQKVGASVLDKTQRSQNPWLSISFTGDFYFNKQK